MDTTDTVTLFDLAIMPLDFEAAVTALCASAERHEHPAHVVVTPNVDHVVRLDRQPSLKALYQQADYIFADGMPIVWASRLLGKPLPERVTGADLFVTMCKHAITRKWRVVLLGGRPGEEQTLKQRFDEHFPGLNITVLAPSMQFNPVGTEGQHAAEKIRDMAPNLIFVCLGLPKQERWALHHAPSFPGGIILCVGAAMEFALGLKSRAPRFVQRLGLEWLWRLASDPKHLWRRYLVDDPWFAIICWREWRKIQISKRNTP